jgi:thiol:disulfide interchange protein DsbA
MLRLVMVISLCLLWLPIIACAQEQAGFQEGTDYRRLETPVATATEDKVEVVETFWYGCGHCYRLEPVIEEWLKKKPDNVTFLRIPAVLGSSWEPHARAYYTAEVLGVLDKTHKPLMDAIHLQKRSLSNEDQLAEFFAEHGVDKEAFSKAYNSFEVETRLQRSQQLVRRYRIQGVPAIIVNGTFVTNGTMAGSVPRIFEVVNYLVEK